ncbi:uncharacterized protein LOC112047310 [Bicyclus anynana]|uniref:Uncharacterized protein LOC112047310 n=1 Tax=Bicyclus anynana TaxID=110368 RepID=A0A6J1N4Z6_BICAN|nr:uncharacterized protein LOC112047310 [Bicyclus anynana]
MLGIVLCVHIAFLGIAFGDLTGTTSSGAFGDGARGNCTCGGFPTPSPAADQLPLLSQSPGLVVACTEEGDSTCKSLCLALAMAAKAKGPEILCNRLGNADDLKLSAFYQACDKPWTYADMSADEPLCCEDSKVKVCESSAKTGTTDAVVV